jgi:hypothetical protein
MLTLKGYCAAAFIIALCLAPFAPVLADDTHHPPAATNQAPVPAPGQTQAPRGGMGVQGMMMGGQGMMMGGQGMMMGMMGQGGGRGGMMSMMGMDDDMRVERVEGHLAFLGAELKITDAQKPLWAAFADAVRANAKRLTDGHVQSPRDAMANPVEALAHREHILATRLEGVKAIRSALAPLYAALTDAQKKTFGELLPMRMMM